PCAGAHLSRSPCRIGSSFPASTTKLASRRSRNRAEERNPLLERRGDDRRPARYSDLGRCVLEDAGVIARHRSHVLGQVHYLTPPVRSAGRCLIAADDEKVDVARRAGLRARERAKEEGGGRRYRPYPDHFAKSLDELQAERRQPFDRRRRQVATVERVQVCL